MDIILLLRGSVIGFSIAAPIGPIGILCIRRTLVSGRASGLASGLGAATAHAIYGCITGFGLTFISNFLTKQQVWIRLIGGVFICYLGLKTLLNKLEEQVMVDKESDLVGAYYSTLLLTLANPVTIILFATVFAGFELKSTSINYMSAGVFVFGIFIGSVLWWFFLSSSISVFQEKLNPHGLQWVNRFLGAIIVWFGLLVLLEVYTQIQDFRF